MRLRVRRYLQALVATALLGAFPLAGTAQNGVRPRITQAVNDAQRITLSRNTHPLARAQYDQGIAPDGLAADRMLLVLKRSPEQESALKQLLNEQQNPASPNYHKWLTPQEFGQKFGPSEADINVVANWLTANGFQVNKVAAGRNVIEFSGNAANIRQAFHTEIHKYVVKGEEHWANAGDPQIPAALAPVVAGVASMNNFRKKPMSHKNGTTALPAKAQTPQRLITAQCKNGSGQSFTCYGVTPYDFATIYNVLPLWTNGQIDGSGQKIAIVGRTNINLGEVAAFRDMFGLPPNVPNLIFSGPDPGIIDGEDTEAYLDVEMSGAIAPQAEINFVVSGGTLTTDGVDLSSIYIVDNNLAPVMSVSFGTCELGLGNSGAQFYGALWEQAAAQGITVSVSSGDNGSAGCDDPNATDSNYNYYAAQYGVSVNGLASTPFNVAVGGTDFDQTATSAPNYWSPSNDPTTLASAKGYIPEVTWNDSCAQSGTSAQTQANCSAATIAQDGIWAGSGGRSGVWQKPSWQSGSGVPGDGARDLPDVSLFSSTGVLSSASYFICDGSCATGRIALVGGTSAAAPAFAGVMALVNQKVQSRVGNANYSLYRLAASQNYDNCDSSTVGTATNACVFYDVKKGNIDVPCISGSTNCVGGTLVDPNNTSVKAWSAGKSYDLATGLGSFNVQNLVNNWTSAAFTPTSTTITNLNPASTHGGTTSLSITVVPNPGSGIPTGDVSLIADYGDHIVAAGAFSLPATGVTTTSLPGGSYGLIAHYGGDGTFAPSYSDPQPVTMAKQSSKSTVALIGIDYTQQQIFTTTSAVYGSPYILRMWATDGTSITSLLSTPCETNPIVCPTGNVTLTDNGSPLDGGTFKLNSNGYVDDESIQLSGGTHTITATYQGDNSFSPSSAATTTVTISPASTTIAAPVPQTGTIYTNQPATISVKVTSPSSNGAAPAGTVTFYADGTALTENVQYAGQAASETAAAALTATISTTFTTTGSKSITAKYNGDTNYAASAVSSATAITVAAGTTPDFTVTASPTSLLIPNGQSKTSTLTVTSTGGFNSPVTFSCNVTTTATVATMPSCTVAPGAVTPAANGTATATVTINTAVLQGSTTTPHKGAGWMLLGGTGVFACVLFGIPGIRRRVNGPVLMVLVSLTITGGLIACGGGGSNGGGNWSGGDTSAPTAPGNLVAAAKSAAEIDLSWSASTDNVAVAGYKVERCQGTGCSNFAQVATANGTSVNDTNLTPSTSYTYRVRATDAAGNTSPYSSAVSASTNPGVAYTVTITATSGSLSHMAAISTVVE